MGMASNTHRGGLVVMKKRNFVWVGILGVATTFTALVSVSFGKSNYLGSLNTRYGTSYSCNVCHTSVPNLNPYGQAYLASGHNFSAIEPLDSDNDGFTNLQELQAKTLPGDPSSKPAAADTTPPTITSFVVPSTWSSLTVPISSFIAADNVGVTGYAVSESSSAPGSGWSSSPPSSYTFSSAGVKTLYGWARDAAGNISSPASAQVTITVDNQPPSPPPQDDHGVQAWVGKWAKMSLFIKKSHNWGELGVMGGGRKLDGYLHLVEWDPQEQLLDGVLYVEDDTKQDNNSGQWLGAQMVPLIFHFVSPKEDGFLASAQFTEDPSTRFYLRFKGRLIKGELIPGTLRSKRRSIGSEGGRPLWFWMKGKIVAEELVPSELRGASGSNQLDANKNHVISTGSH
jgi:hypothetical protein